MFAHRNLIQPAAVVMILLLGLSAVTAKAQDGAQTSPEENKALIAEYLEAISGKEKPAELQDQYIAESDQALKDHIAMLEAAFPRYEFIADDIIAEGDEVVVRATFRGVHQGEFAGIPPTGIQVEMPGIIIYRVTDGKIVEHWLQADLVSLMQQLQGARAAQARGAASGSEPVGDTASIIRAFYEAANAGDWDTALSYWVDDGTFTVMGEAMHGKEQIGAFMQASAQEHGFVEVTQLEATSDSATWVSLPEAGGEFHLSATLKDGKIQSMTIE